MPGDSPSEFGGKVDRRGLQPLPHLPTPSEELSLVYRGYMLGYDDLTRKEPSLAFLGLLPTPLQVAIREQEGAFKKGEAWEEILRQAEASAPENL